MNDSHPTRSLRNACIKLLEIISISSGLHADKMQVSAVKGLASMFHYILSNKSGSIMRLESWTLFGFIRSISSSKTLSKFLTSPTWIDLCMNVLDTPVMGKQDVYKKLQCLRLMQTSLINWESDEVDRIPLLIERIFSALGKICLYCPNDLSLLQNPADVKSRVLYSASYSGTVAEEIISLLRKLHTLPLWNDHVNSFLSQKLCFAADLTSTNETNTSEISDDFEVELIRVAGTLHTIGGYDARPRVGQNLMFDREHGTISKMTKKGKVIVSVRSSHDTKKVPIFKVIDTLETGTFSLSRLTMNEILLNSWAVLLHGTGELTVTESFKILTKYLRKQQLHLASLKATRVLHRHQHLLRKILRQRTPGLTHGSSDESVESDKEGAAAMETKKTCVKQQTQQQQQQTPDSDDDSGTENEILIQTILQRATQPSPLRACYKYQEMELAALSISQQLSSHIHTESNVAGAVSRPVPQFPTLVHGTPVYNNDPIEGAVGGVAVSIDGSSNSNKKGLPPCPLVSQIMEMGFNRKSVEVAIKALTTHTEVTPTVDQIVQWILEHPEVGLPHAFGAMAINDSEFIDDTDSVASDMESSSTTNHDGVIVRYQTRDEFKSADQYAMYIRGVIRTGMIVRCCRDFEEIREGEIGTVLKTECEGLHDLNVRVDWQRHDRPYWMRFVHLEILDAPVLASDTNQQLAVGAQVRYKVSTSGTGARYRWNWLPKNSIGRVTSINGNDITVDFPQQPRWMCHPHELEVVQSNVTSGSAVNTYDIIDDWSRCIKTLTVSSNEASAKFLLNKTANYWQSSNTQGRPWIRLEMHENILIHSLSIVVDADDCSHMPSLLIVKVGDSVQTMKDFSWVSVNSCDTAVPLLTEMKQYYQYIEIVIKQCRNNGIQCKVHGLNIIGRKKQTDLELMLTNAAFLACDTDASIEPSFSTTSSYPDDKPTTSNECTSKVLVWGLNDKEQLGGLKGSKVKLPTYSQVLSQLKPIHIAGGSKSLFIVSQDGKVRELFFYSKHIVKTIY